MPRHAAPAVVAPAYTGRLSTNPIPSLRLPANPWSRWPYRFIHDELMLDGSSRLNLATFVTTWMDPEAEKLMAETFDKNMIDKDEYPATAAIESRCVRNGRRSFPCREPARRRRLHCAIGASTIGSSEAVMLGGLALKWRWKERRRKERLEDPHPNLVMGSNAGGGRFCRYFEVEPRYPPMAQDRHVITPEQVVEAVDEDTIGVVGILGTTYTGESRADRRDLRRPRPNSAEGQGLTSRCTWTPPAEGLWCRSCTRRSTGTSGCHGWRPSTSAATSSG